MLRSLPMSMILLTVLILLAGLASGCGAPALGATSATATPSRATTSAPRPSAAHVPSAARTSGTPGVSKPANDRLGAILSKAHGGKQEDFSYLKKLDSNLQNLLADYLTGQDVHQTAARSGLTVSKEDEVQLDVYVIGSTGPATVQLQQLGMKVQAQNDRIAVVGGWLPLKAVIPAAKLSNVKALLPVMGVGTNTELGPVH